MTDEHLRGDRIVFVFGGYASERMSNQLAGREPINRAGLARCHGITRARVTQVLALQTLQPEVLAWLRGTSGVASGVSERKLRPLLRLDQHVQLTSMAELYPGFAVVRRPRVRAG